VEARRAAQREGNRNCGLRLTAKAGPGKLALFGQRAEAESRLKAAHWLVWGGRIAVRYCVQRG